MGLTAHFLKALQATSEGDGNLLDHSLVLHGGGISDANEHSHIDLPLVLVGGAGGAKGDRVLRHPKDTPMSNLLPATAAAASASTRRPRAAAQGGVAPAGGRWERRPRDRSRSR